MPSRLSRMKENPDSANSETTVFAAAALKVSSGIPSALSATVRVLSVEFTPIASLASKTGASSQSPSQCPRKMLSNCFGKMRSSMSGTGKLQLQRYDPFLPAGNTHAYDEQPTRQRQYAGDHWQQEVRRGDRR